MRESAFRIMASKTALKYRALAEWIADRISGSVSIYLRGSSASDFAGDGFAPWDIDIVAVTDAPAPSFGTASNVAALATQECNLGAPVDLFVVRTVDLIESDKQALTRLLLSAGSLLLWGEDILSHVPQQSRDAATARLIAPELLRTACVKSDAFVSRVASGGVDDHEFDGRAKSLAKAGLRLACVESLVRHGRFVRKPSDCMMIWQASANPVVVTSASVAYRALGAVAREDAVSFIDAIGQLCFEAARYAEL